MKKNLKWWLMAAALMIAVIGTVQSCGKDSGNAAGGVTFYGAGS